MEQLQENQEKMMDQLQSLRSKVKAMEGQNEKMEVNRKCSEFSCLKQELCHSVLFQRELIRCLPFFQSMLAALLKHQGVEYEEEDVPT